MTAQGMPTPAPHSGPVGVDYAVAALTFTGILTGYAVAGQATMAGTVPLATALALFVLFWRRLPVTVLIASFLVIDALQVSALAEAGWIWPATAAFVAAALRTRWQIMAAIGGVQVAFAANWSFISNPEGPSRALAGVGVEAGWLALVLAVTYAVRNWYRWRDEVMARMRLTEHERELQAQRRSAEERLRMAHELHDVVAHTLAVVGVHLNVALDALDSDPAEAKAAVRLAQDSRGKAMADLRSLIGVLRESTVDGLEPQAQLEELAELAARVRAAGLEVDLRADGDPAPVPAAVGLAVYRIVQESLTNTIRHAGASRSVVRLAYTPEVVRVTAVDNGRGVTAPGAETGHGIAGMRERVEALGGDLTVGPAPDGGFSVHAVIPVAGSTS